MNQIKKEIDMQWVDKGEGILLLEDMFDFGEDLIELAEFSNDWKPGTAGGRNNSKVRITDVYEIEEVQPANKILIEYIQNGVIGYAKKYPNIDIREMELLRVIRYQDGGFYKIHSDRGPGTYSRTLSVVIFLNEDFDGGELHFPNQDVTIKPKAGSMVLFPSNFMYSHECKPVSNGNKYAVVGWLI